MAMALSPLPIKTTTVKSLANKIKVNGSAHTVDDTPVMYPW